MNVQKLKFYAYQCFEKYQADRESYTSDLKSRKLHK